MVSLPPSTERLRVALSESILRLELQRAERRNALDRSLVLELGSALGRLPDRPDIRAVILRGSGGSFCAGADLQTIQGVPPRDLPLRIEEFHALIRGVTEAPQPVIAEVDGAAVGFGADLALACDLRVMSDRGYIQESFAAIGLMPDGGGTHFVPQYLGARAFEVLALGERIDAHACLKLGLTSRVVDSSRLESEAAALAARLARAAPLALASIKRALHEARRDALTNALSREKAAQCGLLTSEDFQEGVAAFLEKRAPRFSGR